MKSVISIAYKITKKKPIDPFCTGFFMGRKLLSSTADELILSVHRQNFRRFPYFPNRFRPLAVIFSILSTVFGMKMVEKEEEMEGA